MKYVDEYRDAGRVRDLCQEIERCVTRPWTIMEICGGQTHAIVRFGLDRMLPPEITLLHGPGCPVCVTPAAAIDTAVHIASQPGVIFCSFGDMLRVPGDHGSLQAAKSNGADVRMVYSPLDALRLAQENPGRQVVFFAIGFETTAPATAMAVAQAARQRIDNFSLLVSHVLVPPALDALFGTPDCGIDGLLAAGHVCTVMGFEVYGSVAERYGVPIVVTGFEPVDLLKGVLTCVRLLEARQPLVVNEYARVVRRDGNTAAQDLIRQVFAPAASTWRGLGVLPDSGLVLSPQYRHYDAARRFAPASVPAAAESPCLAGEVLTGRRKPHQCPAFGRDCTPEHALGAPMISSEGACSAYYRYRLPAAGVGADQTA